MVAKKTSQPTTHKNDVTGKVNWVNLSFIVSLARVTSSRVCRVARDAILTIDRLGPKHWACQILTIISWDTAIFVKPCFSNIGCNSNYWGVTISYLGEGVQNILVGKKGDQYFF